MGGRPWTKKRRLLKPSEEQGKIWLPSFKLAQVQEVFSMYMNNKNNFAYQFYRRERNGEDQFIGSLIEKRKKPERITHASIMNWAKKIAFKDVFEERVYFVRVKLQSEAWSLQKLNNIEVSINETR